MGCQSYKHQTSPPRAATVSGNGIYRRGTSHRGLARHGDTENVFLSHLLDAYPVSRCSFLSALVDAFEIKDAVARNTLNSSV